MEGDRAGLHHRGDRLHAGQRLEAGLRLARLGGLVAEAVDEGLDMAPLGLLLGMLGGLVLQVLVAQALEAVVVAGIGRQLRSDERRVGNEGGSKCRSRWSPHHTKQKSNKTIIVPSYI